MLVYKKKITVDNLPSNYNRFLVIDTNRDNMFHYITSCNDFNAIHQFISSRHDEFYYSNYGYFTPLISTPTFVLNEEGGQLSIAPPNEYIYFLHKDKPLWDQSITSDPNQFLDTDMYPSYNITYNDGTVVTPSGDRIKLKNVKDIKRVDLNQESVTLDIVEIN